MTTPDLRALAEETTRQIFEALPRAYVADAVYRALAKLQAQHEAELGILRDWPEDFAGENGKYSCRCAHCGFFFLGYKRRACCKICAFKESTAAVAEALEMAARECEKVLRNYEHGGRTTACQRCANNIRSLKPSKEE